MFRGTSYVIIIIPLDGGDLMNYHVENEYLKITVSDLGAELVSVVSKADGCEYIWQGDSMYWNGHAPVLFPICCRLFGGYCTYEGRQYFMGCHGFARNSVFGKVTVADNSITMRLVPDDAIRDMYPFEFQFLVSYKLSGHTVHMTMTVRNKEEKRNLYFADGGHPGFNVPLDKGVFEDWYVEFDEPGVPDRLLFSDTCFCTGNSVPYPLEDGVRLHLRHDLFNNDALFFTGTCRGVTLKSEASSKSVRLDYPVMDVLGIWQAPKTDAPYVCIEPMNGLPSFDGKVDDLKLKSNMHCLAAGDTHTSGFDMTFN